MVLANIFMNFVLGSVLLPAYGEVLAHGKDIAITEAPTKVAKAMPPLPPVTKEQKEAAATKVVAEAKVKL